MRAARGLWVERVLYAGSAVAITLALVFALKPVDLSGGVETSAGGSGRVRVAHSSCGPAMVAAVRGADHRRALVTDSPLSGAGSIGVVSGVVTCRSEARRQIRLTLAFFLAGVILAGIATLRRDRDETPTPT